MRSLSEPIRALIHPPRDVADVDRRVRTEPPPRLGVVLHQPKVAFVLEGAGLGHSAKSNHDLREAAFERPRPRRARARRPPLVGARGHVRQAARANREGPGKWSFIDGPVTANELAIHTAWGTNAERRLQRYKALRGFDQRYQTASTTRDSGSKSASRWLRLGPARSRSTASAASARECREVVDVVGERAVARIELGQWMDWGNDCCVSDTNIEYIWLFLKTVRERGWLYLGHRSTEWCPRCGTYAVAARALTVGRVSGYFDPSLFVRFPLRERHGEALVVWTTTPWTLPANVAAAVKHFAEYGIRERNGEWVAVERYPNDRFMRTVRGEARRPSL